ncbi:MAG: hypothetical protein J6C23_02730 [Clostridia bacterium]|nr:hypothetical protein [Clostridia bacterium]
MKEEKKKSTSVPGRIVENVKKMVGGTRKKKEKEEKKDLAPHKLQLLFTVVARNKGEFYADLIQNFEVNLQTTVLARGTADTKMLHYLGVEGSEKSVIISVIREDKAIEILSALEEKFNTVRNGKGIAYTVPLTSTVGVALYKFLCNSRSQLGEI